MTSFNKDAAFQQISDIYKVIQGNFRLTLSGNLMILLGIMIASVPLMEIGINTYIDPLLAKIFVFESPAIFFLHIFFYWALFTVVPPLILYAGEKKETMHPIMQRA
jgi:hypothetical protein